MNINYFKNTILSVLGLFLAFSAISMNKVVPDDEMPDNYVSVNVEEETSSNPHRSTIHCVYAYYLCKAVHFEMAVPVQNLEVEIINTSNGKAKTEHVPYMEYSLSVDITGMGVGSYEIYITSNGKLTHSGNFNLN